MPQGAGSSDAGLPAQGALATCSAGSPKALKVYVAGESIEERNRFATAPLRCDGALNDRGADNNDNDEYGWAVPMALRLSIREPSLAFEFVGSSTWSGADDNAYSGAYPSTTAGKTSAIAGTDIMSWLDSGNAERGLPGRRAELTTKKHCYDVAFASRGGNDLNQEVPDDEYIANVKTLVRLLAAGSSCRAKPLVFVTAHLPDRTDVAAMTHAFQTRTRTAVTALQAELPGQVFFIDVYGAFQSNVATKAFPAPGWFSGGVFDNAKISRDGDAYHPRRLASIYAGEVTADALDLVALKAL